MGQFMEKKEEIVHRAVHVDTWLESEILHSEMSIEDECQIDFNMLFLRKSTFHALK